MGNYFCNPINVNYRYQFDMDQLENKLRIAREAADPSMILFQGKYYIFASMTLEVWSSENLADWEMHRLPDSLPLYDYAPDVTVIGDYVYLCASKREGICNYYRTKDIVNGPYEEIPGTFAFWDPNLFQDDDGKLYFYWGCGSMTPIWGVELEPETMRPKGERTVLIEGKPLEKGYERLGEDHALLPLSDEEIEKQYEAFLDSRGVAEEQIPAEVVPAIKGMFAQKPFIEGAWMNKYHGKYYLQYACPGTEYNIYGDGVYESDSPLGPFYPAKNNPYSYKPGGFCTGAGHGSTMWDKNGNLWHASTMRISRNHKFERRVGIWPAGFDKDGELFCNQRYGDWPYEVTDGITDPWKNPSWYLMSYQKPITASSSVPQKGPENAVDENIRTWWQAAQAENQWMELDLEKISDVRAIQINFADDKPDIPVPEEPLAAGTSRHIEKNILPLRWILKGSNDGKEYFIIEDKSNTKRCLPHDLIVREEGIDVRYLRLEIVEIAYHQKPCISGLRVFGIGRGERPEKPSFLAKRISDVAMEVSVTGNHAVGFQILWGHREDKLYHSYMIFGKKQTIGALVKGQTYFVRVDAFNENGITKGNIIPLLP